jgi:hypothetical protein
MEKINFIIREIQQADLQKGFFQTLSNLTTVGRISDDIDQAEKILQEIKSSPLYKIFVAVKNDDGQIIIVIKSSWNVLRKMYHFTKKMDLDEMKSPCDMT